MRGITPNQNDSKYPDRHTSHRTVAPCRIAIQTPTSAGLPQTFCGAQQ